MSLRIYESLLIYEKTETDIRIYELTVSDTNQYIIRSRKRRFVNSYVAFGKNKGN